MVPLKTHKEEWELESRTRRLVVGVDKEVGEGRPVIPRPRGREEAGQKRQDAGIEVSTSSRDVTASLSGTVPHPQETALKSGSDFHTHTLELLP